MSREVDRSVSRSHLVGLACKVEPRATASEPDSSHGQDNSATPRKTYAQPPRLDEKSVSQAALSAMQTFHADVIHDVQESVRLDRVVVVGMAQNPHVPRVRKALDEAGVKYTYLEYGSYLSKWRERLAIKLWSGWPTFPRSS